MNRYLYAFLSVMFLAVALDFVTSLLARRSFSGHESPGEEPQPHKAARAVSQGK